jgi:lysophospholipase L1-like esterase
MKPKVKRVLAELVILAILVASFAAFFFETQPRTRSPTKTIHVACAGDSITNGTEYPVDLMTMLGANYTVGNFGVGEATISLESQRPYIDQPEFQSAKKFMPNIIVIMLGTNDAYPSIQQNPGNFTNDYKKLITSFQEISTRPKIFVVLPPPIFSTNAGRPNETALREDVIPLIKQVANETNLATIDVHTALINHPDYFWDGIHPNNKGARVIATQVYDTIT